MNLFMPLWLTFLGEERMTIAVVEAIYKLKYFLAINNIGEMARAQGEVCLDWSVATLEKRTCYPPPPPKKN